MAKEELKQGTTFADAMEDGKPLDLKQATAYANLLEDNLKKAYAQIKELKKEVDFYQMQDYYQRAQLLMAVISNDSITDELRRRCHRELEALLFPKEPDQER